MQTETTPSVLEGQDAIRALIRVSLVEGLRQRGKDEGVLIPPEPLPPGPVYGHWQSVIFLLSPIMRITLKVFFDSHVSRAQLARIFHRPLADIKDALVYDHMRELLNIAGGSVKRFLEGEGIPAGTSLPLITRGFDEIFFSVANRKDSIVDYFPLRCTDDSQFVAGMRVDVIDWKGVNAFRWNAPQTEAGALSNDGGMDFL